MSLDASRHIWLARTDPKRRTYCTATYVHTLARHGIVYDQPLAVTQRQQGAAIEGALRQRNAPIRRVFADTHGYSAFGMTLGKFEGIDLCPRLRSFKDRRLHIPRGGHVRVPGGQRLDAISVSSCARPQCVGGGANCLWTWSYRSATSRIMPERARRRASDARR